VPPQEEFNEGEQGNPAQLIFVRLVENRCTLSLDSSGALLHRRGYRLETAKAPLRETLAAAMLFASGWNGSSPLLDPFCGAGTIPIEAALLARGAPPGSRRRFAFMDWPNFDIAVWEGVKVEAKPIQPHRGAEILASDRDAGAIGSARANAERAGVAESIQFSSRPISAVDPPKRPGWVVTNPPYGVRLGSKQDLRRLYTTFGKVLRAKCPGWRVAMLCNSPDLLRTTGLKFDGEIQTRNGGLRVKLVWGTV
jgi:putative N6-adenine-specific DNA methylase